MEQEEEVKTNGKREVGLQEDGAQSCAIQQNEVECVEADSFHRKCAL